MSAASLAAAATLDELPARLYELHHRVAVGDTIEVEIPDSWPLGRVDDAVTGAGFEAVDSSGGNGRVRGRRARTLADSVGPHMRLLICGLNPSLYAADAGVAFARPGNRFWPAMLAAELVSLARDPAHALAEHGVGMTDLVKRATVSAAELTSAEYGNGMERTARLVQWLRPGVVCFVGLDGWRKVVDRRAVAGPQAAGFAEVPAYVMPSTSGLNAHSRLADLAEHLRSAAALADR